MVKKILAGFGFILLIFVLCAAIPAYAKYKTNIKPTVKIISPIKNQVFEAPATIKISAKAADKDGFIKKVEFYNGYKKIGTDTRAPYEFVWKKVKTGTYNIMIRATDNNDSAKTTDFIKIKVKKKIIQITTSTPYSAPAATTASNTPVTSSTTTATITPNTTTTTTTTPTATTTTTTTTTTTATTTTTTTTTTPTAATSTATATPTPTTSATSSSGHPRLLVRIQDLAKLRSWAVSSNPIYQNGLAMLAASAKADMDAGHLPNGDGGGAGWEEYPNEMYAELFAFMSLISPDQASRDDYANRARVLLMHAIDRAALGAGSGAFRSANFSISDRSRWTGEGFPLTVDWIYPYLSTADKTKIRTVFLRWSNEILHAETTSNNHPEPIGVINSVNLLSNSARVRFSVNNYYTAHMRNLGLMSMALDPADDAGNELGNYLKNATGAWLYVADYMLRHDGRGGLAPEGFEYGPQSMAYIAQFLTALQTAGKDLPEQYGPQVVMENNPYWNEVVPGFLHSNSPVPALTANTGDQWRGLLYQPAWYGEGQHYWMPDFIALFGAMGIHDNITANTSRLQAMRWIEKNMPEGGASGLADRVRRASSYFASILYYMLFDPTAPAPSDPRPSLSTTFFAEGLGNVLARTDWTANTNWFTYKLGWSSIDHQQADGNMFEFYRKGEWLTKNRVGYGWNVGSTDYKNSVAIHNTAPAHNSSDDYRHINWTRGSQWNYVNDGDGQILAKTFAENYVYLLGDSTQLYNSTYEGATDVAHASRSIIWLKPDFIVVYDRAASKSPNQFKRFWLNLPANASVNGKVVAMSTAKSQKLFVNSLLPANSTIAVEAAEPLGSEPADADIIKYRIKVEAAGNPLSARFLHVLQGADVNESAAPAILIQGSFGNAYDGVAVRENVIMFPKDIGNFTGLTYNAPIGTFTHYVTGLSPNTNYAVSFSSSSGQTQITISQGSSMPSDSGGVLVFAQN
jgi:hypothetical protein